MDNHKDIKEEATDDITQVGTQVRRGSIVLDNVDLLHRRMTNRQLQLLAIGGAVGTALFVSIGNGLAAGGPGSLFIAFFFWSFIVAAVNNFVAERMVLQPVSGGFIRLAGHWYDDALGFMVGWNFYFFEVLAIPFEITAVCLVLRYWTDVIPVWAICTVCLLLYAIINISAVSVFGEAEFWLSGGKVFLILIVFSFTFITMVGGNPKHDAYGFRYWNNPGAFAENPAKTTTGSLARFEGFLACLFSASFTIVGPEYICMAASETMRPRHYVKAAFKTVYWRFGAFFILGALCVGIVVPWNNPTLQGVFLGTAAGGGTITASPYVIAISNLGISGLPHLVNALLITSIFSAGNTYVYCGTKALYGMALEGRAPRILTKCTKKGVPVFAFLVTMSFGLLSYLQVSSGSAKVIGWLISLITGCCMIDYFVMCITFINYYKACQVQGLDRTTLPYCGWFQPYGAYIGAVCTIVIAIFLGYGSFTPWSGPSFVQSYTMQIIATFLFLGWKFIKKTKKVQPAELDLVWERPIIDAYENSFTVPPTGFWLQMGQLLGFRRHIRDDTRAL